MAPAGSVGSSAIQLAKRAGLRVVGSAGTSKGLELVRAEGANHVVNHTEAGYMNEVRRVTGDKGPELILEMLANVNLAADMELAAKCGRIVVIGNRGDHSKSPRCHDEGARHSRHCALERDGRTDKANNAGHPGRDH